ncbi:flagellar hook-basal body complex protein [Pseudoflavonifractor sp. 524-17]|uniref:flagellar hook-basal body complex protein n=1 Tax=Pseudoflavonifractor sp. 524-17 TaxID=2304577 RepID=UPI00137B4DF0|nr:flagellar hook-basal body complex protein [Pseudoflavonifractor sp. 524-17]
MTGAMYAAVSGLKAHMSGLNVIGNNIANVNTMGYKAGRYVFETALYTSLNGGSNGTQTVGGKNPSQIGMGTNMATVDINMGTSTYVPTGRPMDCMIDGDGFFLLGETKNMTFNSAEDFKALLLTKVGDLEFKADGTLSNRAGYVVYGFQCTGQVQGTDTTIPVVSNQLSPITLPKQVSVLVDVTVDANGVETLTPVTDPTQAPAAGATREKRTYVVSNAEQLKKVPGMDAATQTTFDELPHAEMDSITIDEKTGRISGTTKDTDQHITIGFLAIGNVTNPNGVTQVTGTYFQCGEGAGAMSIAMLGGSAAEVYDKANMGNFELDASGIWQPPQGGGTLTKGMTHITANGGKPDANASDTMAIKTGGTTKLLTSGLEQTNTDLATEISNMIFMQRGYQANTRIVTVTDSMLEELVNMKR